MTFGARFLLYLGINYIKGAEIDCGYALGKKKCGRESKIARISEKSGIINSKSHYSATNKENQKWKVESCKPVSDFLEIISESIDENEHKRISYDAMRSPT